MAKKKKKSNLLWKRGALLVIAALILMFGTAAIVDKLLEKQYSSAGKVSAPPSTVTPSNTASPANKGNVSNKADDKGKIEPDVVEKQNKENIPEQGKVDNKIDSQPEQSKSPQISSALQPVKANDKLMDPFFENYLNIYVNLANDSELEFYYFDNVVLKSSNFYKALNDEIQKLRQTKIKYVLNDFKVENISKGESESELIVQVSQVINKKTEKYSYVVYFDKSGVFIKDRKQ